MSLCSDLRLRSVAFGTCASSLSEQRGMRRKGCHLSQTPEKGETDLSLSNEKMPKPLLMRIGAFFSPLFLKKNRAPFRSLGLLGERER